MLLVFIFSTLISRWVMYKGFIHTDWFSGPQQFAAQQILYFLLDLYIMMYCPFKWIRNSTKNNWAGWAKIKPRKQKKFFYVHKPDPREELKKMGYFKKSGKNILHEENDQMHGQHFEMERGVHMKIQNFKKLLTLITKTSLSDRVSEYISVDID